jgi:hypothetical protein
MHPSPRNVTKALSRGVCLYLVVMAPKSGTLLLPPRLSLSDDSAFVATDVRTIFLVTVVLLFTSNCAARSSEESSCGELYLDLR